MKITRQTRLIVLCAISISTAAMWATGGLAADRGRRERQPGELIYQLRDHASANAHAAFESVAAQHGLAVEKDLLGGKLKRARVHVPPGQTEEDVCAKLENSGAVVFAEPDYVTYPVTTANDPGYNLQWQHATINSPGAWSFTVGSPSIIVAICDTGVESSHPDLAANVLLPGYNAVDGSTNTSPVHWHGTAVAGCVGAVGNNGIGVVGVNWTVKLLPIRVSNQSNGSSTLSAMSAAVQYAANHGAKVANLSYSGADSSTMNAAGQYIRDRGGLLFMAAGNDGVQESYPDYTSFVAVSATTASDTLASWSSYGTYVDIAAPGNSVYTTYTGGSYAYVSGTSFSSPIAAGLAALVWSVNPSFTPAQVEDIIFSTCVDLGPTGDDIYFGHGRINAAAAVAKAEASLGNSPPTAVANASTTSGDAPLTVDFDGSGSTDPDHDIVSYAWNFGDGHAATGPLATNVYATAGSYTATLTVTDSANNQSTATVTITVADPNFLNAPSSLTGKVSGRTVTLTWKDNSANENGFRIERGIKTKKTTTWTLAGTVGINAQTFSQTVASGTYSYRVQAYNSTAGTSAYSNTIQIRVK